MIHVYDPYTGTGKVIAFDREDPYYCLTPTALYWMPSATPGSPGTFESIPNNNTDMFCAGHAALPDGRILTVGGNFGCNTHADIFEPLVYPPSALSWIAADPMHSPRWHPTATVLPSGWVLATASALRTCLRGAGLSEARSKDASIHRH
jgi:hypothetical protein